MSTLAQLRPKIADRLNALFQGTVTAVKADATLAAFVDTTTAGEFENLYRNAAVIFTGGTAGNVGQWRRVAGNRDGLISFRTPFPVAPQIGDAYDLYRRFTPTDFRTAINWAIDNVFPMIFVRFQQEVPEQTSVRDYPYPDLTSPAALAVVKAGVGGATSYLYRLASRNRAGDAVPSPASTAVINVTPLTTVNTNTLTWTAVSNTDAILVLRSIDAGATWKLLSAVPNLEVDTAMTFVDNGSYDAASTAYVLATSSPPLLDLRQLWRRANPGATPATYTEMRGDKWIDQGKSVRIRWAPASGQALCFVGYASFAPLSADTDAIDGQYLPDELVIRGAAKILYENLMGGEAASSTQYFERQAKYWSDLYDAKKREFAMEQIGREQHPPEIHVVRSQVAELGPYRT